MYFCSSHLSETLLEASLKCFVTFMSQHIKTPLRDDKECEGFSFFPFSICQEASGFKPFADHGSTP